MEQKYWINQIGFGNNSNLSILNIHCTETLRLNLEYIENTQYKQFEAIFKAIIPLFELHYKVSFRHLLSETDKKDEKDHKDSITIFIGEPDEMQIVSDSQAIAKFSFPIVSKSMGNTIEAFVRNLAIIFDHFIWH